MVVEFPALTAYQLEALDFLGDPFKSGKVAVIKSVRQSGKTFFCVAMLARMALEHPGSVSAVVEPTLNQARNVFNTLNKAFADTGLIVSANASLLTMTFTTGSEVLFKSTEQGEGLRSFTVSGLLILDEAAYLNDEAVYTVLPLVNVHNAPIIVCSTPFLMSGYYWDMYKMATERPTDTLRAFDWSQHPEIGRFLTEERKAFYNATMSRAKYTTEVLGEFLSSDGLLFTNIEPNLIDQAPEASTLYMGIDFATGSGNDYTVLAAFNERGEMVALHRTNNLSPMAQVEWLAGLINDMATGRRVHRIYAEENSIGKVYLDALKAKIAARITPWTTTNQSKQDIVTGLQIALENERVKLLRDTALLDELAKFEAVVNPKTKKVTYGGHLAHDDTVMATMLGYHAYTTGTARGCYSISIR